MRDHLSIAIIGSGAVGLYYGALLAQANNDVRFLLRSGYDDAKGQGIRIQTKDNTEIRIDSPVFRDTADIGICDFVLIATKTMTNPELPAMLRPIVGENTYLLTLQNGLGNEEFLASHFGADHILGGLCFVCLNRISPAAVRHIDHGLVSLAPMRPVAMPACEEIALAMKNAGIPVETHHDLILQRWKKLLWNIPFNGLTILHGGIAVDKILETPSLFHECRLLMYEIREIARLLGYDIPHGFINELITRTHTMGAYHPSSLVDHLNGREIELDAIWGEPLRQAKTAGAPHAHLEKLHAGLTALIGKSPSI